MKNKVVYNNQFGGFRLSNKAKLWLSERGMNVHPFNDDYYFLEDVIPRHDPLLIQCVEELGKEAGNEYSDLCIAEIEDYKYIIQEYDGLEKIITPNDIDWITIEK